LGCNWAPQLSWRKSGNAAVTMEHELGAKTVQMVPRSESPAAMRPARLLTSFAQLVQTLPNDPKEPFHGGNTGSNPVGDANKTTDFHKPAVFLHDPI
jgi:hypothetical protein